jgi:serine/threonine protein kinase
MNRFNEDYNPADPTRGLLDHTNEDDPRLLEAIKEYTAAMESGKRINRQEFLAKHADIAADLSVCLNSLNFIQTAAAQIPGTPTSEPQVHSDLSAKPLGDFKLVREIGRGGMGVVYEAVQLSLGRRVAVKVLSLAAALDPRHLQRFKNEAQAAAQLHHTNIVPVYAVGCERSVHFYAMQLIDGQTLADVVRDLRRLANRTPVGAENGNGNGNRTHIGNSEVKDESPSPSISPMTANRALSTQVANLSVMHSTKRVSFCKSIARIGLQAADALEYAHKLGVVHRDIKPANLMLDVTGNLWITDFGLAQFYAADSGLTQTGDLVGTYRYMSPEQASGRAVVLDQRTDIYSLGVTLYEVLTLERAVPGETRDELLHQISNIDPRSPRLIDKTIPQELDTILMKSIAKDPADRYSSAKAMADDLRRFLDDQPILARPPSAFDKAVKWTKRHRAITLTTILMLLLIAAGLAVSTALIARAQAKTKVAYKLETDKAEEAKQAQIRAERSFKQARDAVDFFTQVAAEKMAPGPGLDTNQLRKQMLETALLYYQGFLEDHKDDPGTGESLSLARSHVSAILTELASGSELFRRQRSLRLLGEESVQKDLNMSPDQVSRFNNSELAPQRQLKWFFEAFSKSGSQSPEQNSQELNLVRARLDADLSAILNPAQLERFQQIYLQVSAPFSFQDPKVEEGLALTKDQKDEIQKILNKYRSPPRGGPPPDGRGPGFGRGPDGAEARGPTPDDGPHGNAGQTPYTKQDAVNDILKLLTDEQSEQWEALTGAAFTGNIREGIFGPPGGRRGRR